MAEETHARELFAEEVPASQTSEYFTIRRSRHSKENPAISPNSTKSKSTSKLKEVLVKKPIPKFTDTSSDDYYQAKIRFPNRISTSIEHEDEDFSIDDYEFDVNHDEYAGRGKPLEPRLVSKQRPKPPDPSKAAAPHKENPSVKVAREAVTEKAMDDAYDDEFSTGFHSPEKRIKVTINDDTSSDENGESNEEVKRSMRTTRSSPFSLGTFMNKLGETTSDYVSKMFSFLPLFPASYFSTDDGIGRVKLKH